jgi:nucleolar protein 56
VCVRAAFLPFESAESALENISAISEGDATKYLTDFLEMNLPKGSMLGVSDTKLGNVLSETMRIKVKSNETVLELLRGVRNHFQRFIKSMKPGDAQQAMLGLGHSYSRSKVKFNVHRVDNMIIQSSALLDQLDKGTFTLLRKISLHPRQALANVSD